MVVARMNSFGEADAEARLETVLREAVVRGPRGSESPPPRLQEALMHAVVPGGARVRPRLCLAVVRAAGGPEGPLAYAAAAALELLHCASLVHDDLPCFDAADLRRGRPTVHKVWGEAMAVLVGDGLIVLAFDVLARALAAHPAVGVAPLVLLSSAAGVRGGLVGGQAWELEDDADLAAYHRAKTASLFEAAAALGALVSGVDPVPFARLGRELGMTYQLADDLADRVASAGELGKLPGRDAALGRPTAAAGDVDLAQSRLRLAMKRTLDAVPACSGQRELRALLAGVLAPLGERCRLGRSEPPEGAPEGRGDAASRAMAAE